jgi:SAM-dependent methyltransferase
MAQASSTDPALIFNRALVALRRRRASAHFAQADFLKRRAVEDVCDRLDVINRTFPLAAEVGPPSAYVRDELISRGLLGTKVKTLADIEADEEWLPFAPESLDLVISTNALHWVNDLPGTLVQIRRALRPDGLLLATFLGGRTLQELRQTMFEAEMEVRGGAGARVSPFADAQDGARLLQRAGFALPVADSDVVVVRYDNIFGLFKDLKAMGETAAFAQASTIGLTREVIAKAAALYQSQFADPDGRVRASFEIVTLTGWAPHESQQKPLRPGSAKMRLADALGAVERSAGDKAG